MSDVPDLSNSILLKAEEGLRLTQYEHIGVSFGIASSLEAANQSESFLVADQRMYKHKQAKRECSGVRSFLSMKLFCYTA
ncbi:MULTISPECIES: hypothetical protein [unclassified Neptuniibacter]|uniref:hypothetical protein n=1 Tax=unclassified Neptuniibacter TaxID=2630693 RepID=UPI000C44EEF7|nr:MULTISPECIES: hypothetical protein [unclassified Neptuniibacter]MAY41198.1 hypothetical protein [Oceanospirillaceae bacterium]|tara:strand:+ start:4015 stop:4254 length:240 start_codon:yes stop_codon:yes gene_type:complete